MTKPAAYDAIAERYRESKWLLFRHYVERYTLLELLGDLQDRTVLDLACGEGIYAREFMRAGAAAVTGVDVSGRMIALAEAREREELLGCRYVCEDAATYTPPAQVDIVTAIYLLNYARTRIELDRFFQASYRALRPGGRLVGFNDNVRRPPRPEASLAKYGFERTCPYPPSEGDTIRYRMTNHDGRTFEFENYYLQPATYAAAARDAGFHDFSWVDARLDPAAQDDSYWDDFMAWAPVTALAASKPQEPGSVYRTPSMNFARRASRSTGSPRR